MPRVPPKVHAALITAAKVSGKSINHCAAEVLGKAT
ncbi:toxin-antitoxin system HicB family antitoxin [Endozoicomonas sp. 8E]